MTCSDLKHCCPHGTTCDVRQGACVSDDGTTSVPWIDKTKATFVSAHDNEDTDDLGDDEDVDDEEEQAFDAKFVANGKEAAGSSVATMAVERQGQKKCSKKGGAGVTGGETVRGMGGVMVGQQEVGEGQQAVEV